MRYGGQLHIQKVIQHPARTCEIQLRKPPGIVVRAGQYIFLSCPAVNLFQFHPFTLTSAPEEDYLSVHMRCVGDFTNALGTRLGCDFAVQKAGVEVQVNDFGTDASTMLPRVMIDGPFGSASEDVFDYEVVMLVGAGIGVTPFASILKSIWYRVNEVDAVIPVHKVHFFWICRDFESFAWFRSLLLAIEAEDRDGIIEVHCFLTARLQQDDAGNLYIHNAGAAMDAITGLRSSVIFGRPDWDHVFRDITKRYPRSDVGVFYCGPKALGSSLHIKCNEHSQDGSGTQFVFGKENF